MNRRPTTIRRLVGPSLVLLGVLLAPSGIRGEDPPGTLYSDWRLLEPSPEMIEYKGKLKEGTFDEAARGFLTKIALPQLGLEKNRPTIDRVRRRIRDVLCGDASTDQKAANQAMQVVTDFMIAVARDANADIGYRVNATLLVGELRGPGTKPWVPASAPLAAVFADEALPPAVRIAAAAGLARLVDADPAARAKDVGPALLKVAGSPLAGIDPVAADWLRSRALAMLARLGSNAPDGTAAAAAGMLRDAARPVDVRVRAAAAAGACIKAAGDTDVNAAMVAIRDLATAALDETRRRDERRELAARLGGGVAEPGPRPGFGPEAMNAEPVGNLTQAYHRDAWRLAALANALAPSGEGGLVKVAGASAPAVTALARALLESARTLDAQPDAASVENALAAIAASGNVPPALPGAGSETPAPGEAAPGGVDGVPFGDR